MSKPLVELVLPRLAQRLHRQMQRCREGQLSEAQFTRKFEMLLQNQYNWLARRGVAETDAAVAIHGAVLVLSGPGLRAEAGEQGLPMEVVEYRAIKAAAEDIAQSYGISQAKALRKIVDIVATHGE